LLVDLDETCAPLISYAFIPLKALTRVVPNITDPHIVVKIVVSEARTSVGVPDQGSILA
jgi:hypothetical protein